MPTPSMNTNVPVFVRLQWQYEVNFGGRRGRKLDPGGRWLGDDIKLRMLDVGRDFDLTAETLHHQALQKGLEDILKKESWKHYNIAVSRTLPTATTRALRGSTNTNVRHPAVSLKFWWEPDCWKCCGSVFQTMSAPEKNSYGSIPSSQTSGAIRDSPRGFLLCPVDKHQWVSVSQDPYGRYFYPLGVVGTTPCRQAIIPPHQPSGARRHS